MTVANTDTARAAVEPQRPQAQQDSLAQWMERQKGEIARALGSKIDADRFATFALTAIRQTPELQRCTPDSMLAALMLSAQIGLEPGPFGYIYLNPRNRKLPNGDWIKEVQFSIGYKGLVALAQRSPQIRKVQGHTVYANDVFDVEYGLNENLIHKPNLTSDRGEVVGSYAVAEWVNGARSFVYLTLADINKRRAAAGKGGESGPWKTHFEQMARKSAVRDLAAFLPLDTDAQQAIALDDQVHTDVRARLHEREAQPFDEQAYAEGVAALEASGADIPHDGPVPSGEVVSGVVVPSDAEESPAPAQPARRGRAGGRSAAPPDAPADEPAAEGWPPVRTPGGGA